MRHTVLFVDDEPHVLSALARNLRSEAFEFARAGGGAEALELLRARPVDAIVSDSDMPGMSGAELLAQARVLRPTSVRMMLTGKPTLDSVIEAVNRGEIQRFFLKPCDPQHLAGALRHALKEKDLLEQARRLLLEFRRKNALLEELERTNPGLTDVRTDAEGCILLEDVPVDLDHLLSELQASIGEPGAAR